MPRRRGKKMLRGRERKLRTRERRLRRSVETTRGRQNKGEGIRKLPIERLLRRRESKLRPRDRSKKETGD